MKPGPRYMMCTECVHLRLLDIFNSFIFSRDTLFIPFLAGLILIINNTQHEILLSCMFVLPVVERISKSIYDQNLLLLLYQDHAIS